MKKLCVICALILLLALPALAEDATGPLLVAENERLRLYLSEDLAGVEIEDKRTGMRWSSSMNDENFTGKVNALWTKRMSSLMMINYTNLKQGLGVINNTALLADKQYSAQYELIEGGVKLRYDLGACKIALSVELTLEGDSLLARIPFDGIDEYGSFSIVSVDFMPFLCSASDEADGYFLYPDGSGALMEFKDNAHLNGGTQLYNIYGNFERQSQLLDFFEQEEPTVLLPVFGMRRSGHGLMAIIESGDETGRISLNCSNNIVKVNYLYANFQYRRGFDDKRVTSRSIKIYDNAAIETDYALRVLFLDDDKADYSGMACAYRDYLIQNGTLSTREARGGMALDLFLTTQEDGLLYDAPRTVTTLSQACDILDALYAEGMRGLSITLKGWSRDGWGKPPDAFPISGAAGGEADMRALAAKAESYGYTISIAANLLEADGGQSGYSKRNDVVYLGNYTILTDARETLFMLSPDVTAEKSNEIVSRAARLGISGVRFERLGLMMGYNYNSRSYLTSAQSVERYREMLTSAKRALGRVSAQGGAAWLLKYVDQVTHVPYADNGFQFTTRAVPFYHIVTHGLMDYAAEPGNLSSDLDREVLRWVEMGYTPYFELTYDNTEALMYTSYQSLFTAQYTAWLDRVAEIAEAFESGELRSVRDALIVSHARLTPDIYRVTYDNGVNVYVNYGAEAADADALTVPAMGYLVTGEGIQ